MIIGRTTYNAVKQRQKSTGELSPERVFFSSDNMLINLNNTDIKRPLKRNSENSSFKGLSFRGASAPENKSAKKEDKMKPLLATLGVLAATGLALRFAPAYKEVGKYSISEFTKFINEKSGIESSIIEKHFSHLKKSKLTDKMIKVDGDNVTFYKKTIPQLIWDGLMYPFKILPADILNGSVELIGKIKPFKGWAEKTLKKPMFVNIRQRSKIDAEVNSLRGLFKMSSDLKGKSQEEIASKMFQQSVKSFDPTKGQYDTKHERSLNRLVSGLPPAIFLANDAYNLSRMMDDDDKAAKHEQKTRFKQEAARLGFNAYITLITLGALQKYINNSALGIFLTTGATTLTTEAFSRLINGKHITRLTPEEARKENTLNDAPEAKIKPAEVSFKSSEAPKKDEKQQKPLLSFDTIMKASGIIIAGGFGVKALRKIPAVEKQWKAFTGFFSKQYKEMTVITDYSIRYDELKNITKVLENNGFSQLAKKYTEIADKIKFKKVVKEAVNGEIQEKVVEFINLGQKDKKIKPLVNFIIAPFKFAWNTITLPYNLTMKVVKPIQKYFSKTDVNQKVLNNDILKSEVSSLAKSIENIGTEALKKNFNPKQFETYVRDNIMKSFNVETMSNLSNSELSNLAKTAASIATIWFLMTDNYNMVMLKSNGNDVEGAKTKFKERFVQEGSRLFYQTLLIDLFNSTFRSQYNKSLFGMSWITLTNTTMGEWLTRASVGVPTKTHSREELLELERKQDNATGLKRKYFDFMKRLTGKRSIKSYEVKPNNTQQSDASSQQNTTNINFTNTSILNKIIKE